MVVDLTSFDPLRCQEAGVTLAEADCLAAIENAGRLATHEIRRRFGPVVGRGIRAKKLAEPRGVRGPAQPDDLWFLTAAGKSLLDGLRPDVGARWPRALPPNFQPAPRPGQFVLVRIEHMPGYRARHGVRVVRGDWEPGADVPTLEVDPL